MPQCHRRLRSNASLQRPKTNFLPSTRSQVCETKTQCAHVLPQTQMTTDTVHSTAEGDVNVTVEILIKKKYFKKNQIPVLDLKSP